MDQQELLKLIEETVASQNTTLDLYGEGLTELPPEIGRLTHLKLLVLRLNPLAALPPEIGAMQNLTRLYLSGNPLAELPAEIGQLTNLEELVLRLNRLIAVPPEIGNLYNLTRLDLSFNQLEHLPPEIGELDHLLELDLSGNQLLELPPEIGNLRNLTHLDLSFNPLTELPPEIGKLSQLAQLDLSDNQLRELPPELGQLSNLSELDLSATLLSALPPELGQLSKLKRIKLGEKWGLSHRLLSPPPEIIQQGTQAILAYLQDRLAKSRRQWVSKLLVVGEGGVGKTSLLRVLRGEAFNPQESTTHGIEIGLLKVPHPTEENVTMELNTWDFGGQEIYHATHQFFLTNRSLFLLAWNARHGYEQGKLYYWLDTIQALAPDSPVLLVATHIDQRQADLPLTELHRKYPQIVGHCEISNPLKQGLVELSKKIGQVAADLPLMGEFWPAHWLDVANAIRVMPEKYITPRQLRALTARHKVVRKNAVVLAQWLHELGDILFFQFDNDLNDIVILKPQWVTEYISKVLESEEVIQRRGIFTRSHMQELWPDLDPVMRNHFMNLMEKFDLSYKTLENREISLVVERLPLDPPDYEPAWEDVRRLPANREVSMKFQLNTIPAGIPTWFIARSHRFTTHTHWRNGALFTDGQSPQHLALIQAFPHDRYVQLTVRGPNPHNFFALLRDGFELTLRRFPGLHIDRKIRYLAEDNNACDYYFDYDHLLTRIDKKPMIECPASPSLEDVSVHNLLFGLHQRTQKVVLERLAMLHAFPDQENDLTRNETLNLRPLVQREFTNAFAPEQAKVESHVPGIFALRPASGDHWPLDLTGQEIQLQLYCQAPGQWHPVEHGGLYTIQDPLRWLVVMAPYLKHLLRVFQFATSQIQPTKTATFPDFKATIERDMHLFTALMDVLPQLEDSSGLKLANILTDQPTHADQSRAHRAALQTLRSFLDEADPRQRWGDLQKVLTPEGHYLWLCDKHVSIYVRY